MVFSLLKIWVCGGESWRSFESRVGPKWHSCWTFAGSVCPWDIFSICQFKGIKNVATYYNAIFQTQRDTILNVNLVMGSFLNSNELCFSGCNIWNAPFACNIVRLSPCYKTDLLVVIHYK